MSEADAFSPARHRLAGVLLDQGSAALIRLATTRWLAGATVSVIALCVGATAPGLVHLASAEPLPKERCQELAAERTLLEGGGAGDNVQRGPEWAKANLTPEQISYVRRLIEVREDLLFRCRTFELADDDSPPSSAPAMAPLPVRKPAAPHAVKADAGVPPPVRPERVEWKAKAVPANQAGTVKDGASAVGGAKPKLRGTLPASQKATSAAVPAPAQKSQPTSQPAGGN